MFYMLTIFTAM